MGFADKIKRILGNEKLFHISRICNNFWCKAGYDVISDLYREDPNNYGTCPKCRSYSNNPLLSGGVTDNGTIEYEGERFDPNPQEIMYKEYKNGSVEQYPKEGSKVNNNGKGLFGIKWK